MGMLRIAGTGVASFGVVVLFAAASLPLDVQSSPYEWTPSVYSYEPASWTPPQASITPPSSAPRPNHAELPSGATAVGTDGEDRISAALRTALVTGHYNPEVDFTGDGIINAEDVLLWLGSLAGLPPTTSPPPTLPLRLDLERRDPGVWVLCLRSEGPHTSISGLTAGLVLRPEASAAEGEALPLLAAGSPLLVAGPTFVRRGIGLGAITIVEPVQHALSDDDSLTLAEFQVTAPFTVRSFAVEPLRDSIVVGTDGRTFATELQVYELVVRTAADLDGDGTINRGDLVAFVRAFGSDDRRLDLNGDAAVDQMDYDVLLRLQGLPALELRSHPDAVPFGAAASALLELLDGHREAAPFPPTMKPGDADGTEVVRLGPRPDVEEVPNPGAGLKPAHPSDHAPFGVGEDETAPRIDRVWPTAGTWVVDQRGLTELRVGFDQDVTIPVPSVRLWGTRAAQDVPFTRSYDATTRTLTLTPNSPLRDDRFTLLIDYTVVNAAGVALDGEVAQPLAAILPSGDGIGGGQAVFQFNVLQGDVNRDEVVDQVDRDELLAALGSSVGGASYNPNADLNADGAVNVLDVNILQTNFGRTLGTPDGTPPSVDEQTPAPGATVRALTLDTVQVAFSEPMEPARVSRRSLHAVTPAGEVRVPKTVDLASDGRTATFAFAGSLADLGLYDFRLSNGLSDRSGELLAAERWTAALDNAPARLIFTSPFSGEDDVAVTRETIVEFDHPLNRGSVVPSAVFAQFGGSPLAALVYQSLPGNRITLFYSDNLQASARIRVTIDGGQLVDDLGLAVDANGDGAPGGIRTFDFDTLSLTEIPGTAVCGRVFASELASDGVTSVDVPLAGVTVSVDGREDELFALTDEMGNFRLEPAPVGRFFVHIDGRTATNPDIPEGAYYPFVGKVFNSIAGQETNPKGEPIANADKGEIYLPLVSPDALQPVSQSVDTTIHLPQSVIDQFSSDPDIQAALAAVSITVPADSLFADGGTRGGMVGIAPVPPDRIPGPLPEGLNIPLVITVQTNGPTNFDVPVPAMFPNLPDPVTGEILPPGAKTALWSFDHDLGDWILNGPMTVSNDGLFLESDEGFGIRAPGWHGAWPGSEVNFRLERLIDPDQCLVPGLQALKEGLKVLEVVGGFVTDTAAGVAMVPTGTIAGCIVGGPGGCALGAVYGFQVGYVGSGGIRDFVVGATRTAYDTLADGFADGRSHEDIRQQIMIDFGVDAVKQGMRLTPIAGGLFAVTDDVRSAWDQGGTFGDRLGQLRNCLVAESSSEERTFANLPGRRALTPEEARAAFDSLANFAEIPPAADAQVSSLVATSIAYESGLETFPSTYGTLDQLAFAYAKMMVLLEIGAPEADVLHAAADMRTVADSLQDLPRGSLGEQFATEVGDLVAEIERVSSRPPMVSSETVFYRTIIQNPLVCVFCNPLTGRCSQFICGFLPPFEVRSRSIGSSTISIRAAGGSRIGFEVLGVQDLSIGGFSPAGFAPGQAVEFPVYLLPEADSVDTDDDGLSDSAESIIGTDPHNPDTDGDGVSDGAEIQNGTDPLDGLSVRAGIIASVNAPGPASDVATFGDRAVVTSGAAGVSVFNVFLGLNPILIAQVDTPGEATAVAFTGDLVAIADGSAGLTVIDVTDPPAASILHRVPAADLGGSARAVTTAGNIALVGTSGGTIATVDMVTGAVLDTVVVGPAIQDLAIDGRYAYALTDGTLRSYDFTTGRPVLSDSVTVQTGVVGSAGGSRSRLSVGGGLAYCTHRQGFSVVDTSDPFNMVRQSVSGELTPQFGWKQIVPNGSGLGVATVSPNSTSDGPHHVSLYDLNAVTAQNQSISDSFLATFETPGVARAVSIFNGLAYVADNDRGLQVINYREFDRNGVPPAVSFTVTEFGRRFADLDGDGDLDADDLGLLAVLIADGDLRGDLNGDGRADQADLMFLMNLITSGDPDPATDGLVEEGQLLLVEAIASDDVQVRNVELLIDGEVVQTDGNFPFQFFVNAPAFASPDGTEDPIPFQITVRASDTGGNRTDADVQTLRVQPDRTAPTVVAVSPADGSTLLSSRPFDITFSESVVAVGSLSDAISVVSAGDDELFGTPDDVPVGFQTSVVAAGRRLVVRTNGLEPIGQLRLTLRADLLADAAGNVLDGDGDGIPGGEFIITVDRSRLPYGIAVDTAAPAGALPAALEFEGVPGATTWLSWTSNRSLEVALVSPSGQVINSSASTTGRFAEIRMSEAGGYRILLRSTAVEPASVTVALSDQPIESLPEVSLGVQFTGSLSPFGDVDEYPIQLSQGQIVTVYASKENSCSSTDAVRVQLVDPISRQTLASGATVSGPNNCAPQNSRIATFAVPATGLYLVRVTTASVDGRTFDYTVLADAPGVNVQTLPFGQAFGDQSVQLGEIDCWDINAQSGQVAWLSLSQPTSVGVPGSASHQMNFILMGPDGSVIDERLNTIDYRREIVFGESGVYRFMISPNGPEDSSGYTIGLSDELTSEGLAEVSVGVPFAGSLSPFGDVDEYPIQLSQGQIVNINVTSVPSNDVSARLIDPLTRQVLPAGNPVSSTGSYRVQVFLRSVDDQTASYTVVLE